MGDVVKHPRSQRQRVEVAERFLKLQKIQAAAANRMWAGTLALAFTDEELTLIPDLLCPNDLMLLNRINDPTGQTKKRKVW